MRLPIFPVLCLLVSGSQLSAAEWPEVKVIEAQPLLAQVKRLGTALDTLGQPLPDPTRAALAKLHVNDGVVAVARVQELLDSHCFAAVEIDATGVSRVIASPRKPVLVEQGWRAYLVKVVNAPGATGQLRIESDSARPVPNAPAKDVANRWLDLQPYTAQPMLPSLSGLGLEYVIVQLYSRDPGEKSADITFRVDGGSGLKSTKAPIVREWKFTKDTDGWADATHCRLDAVNGSLRVTITEEDPYFSTRVVAEKEFLVLRFWATFPKAGFGQVFWSTKRRHLPDGRHGVNFAVDAGRGHEYEVKFRADDDLIGIRIDPGNDPGTATFDWISLGIVNGTGTTSAHAKIAFTAVKSIPVTFEVAESDGKAATAAFLIRDTEGRVYPAQSKRLAPDFFFQPQVYRSTGETVHLPAGTYRVACSRGPESIPEVKSLVVGDHAVTFGYTVARWIDPSKKGWYSGDHHIHAAGCMHYDNPTEGVEPSDMMRHILGEDVKVGCCLTWGPCFDYQKRFFTGKPDDVSQPPYILRYDVEVSGFGSHASGHLNLLNLTEQIPPGGKSKDHWPTLGMNTLRWAKKQGAICGPAHSGNGLTRFVGRIAGAKDGPNRLPHFDIPAYDGIGANEFIVDVTHNVPGLDGELVPAVDFISAMDTSREAEWTMWYHVLNCGFRTRASGETDFPCITGDRVGLGRSYAKVDGDLTFKKWVSAIHDGRSYVSDGTTHLMNLTASASDKPYQLGINGSEIKLDQPGKLSLSVQAAARHPGKTTVPVELVVNGLPVETQDMPCDGKIRDLTFKTDISTSSWVAIRVFPSSHTNPFFVIVDGKPIRANKQSAEWCLAGVEQCWKSKARTYRPVELAQAEADYDHARQVYRAIISESK